MQQCTNNGFYGLGPACKCRNAALARWGACTQHFSLRVSFVRDGAGAHEHEGGERRWPRCYRKQPLITDAQGRATLPTIRFELELHIARNGRVRQLDMEGDVPESTRACSLAAARRFRFPRAETWSKVSARYEFDASDRGP